MIGLYTFVARTLGNIKEEKKKKERRKKERYIVTFFKRPRFIKTKQKSTS